MKRIVALAVAAGLALAALVLTGSEASATMPHGLGTLTMPRG